MIVAVAMIILLFSAFIVTPVTNKAYAANSDGSNLKYFLFLQGVMSSTASSSEWGIKGELKSHWSESAGNVYKDFSYKGTSSDYGQFDPELQSLDVDASYVNDFLSQCSEIQGKDVYLIGHSLGGVVASYWAATKSLPICGGSPIHVMGIFTIDSPVNGVDDSQTPGSCYGSIRDQMVATIGQSILPAMESIKPGTSTIQKVQGKANWQSKIKLINLESIDDCFIQVANAELKNVADKIYEDSYGGINVPTQGGLNMQNMLSHQVPMWDQNNVASGHIIDWIQTNVDNGTSTPTPTPTSGSGGTDPTPTPTSGSGGGSGSTCTDAPTFTDHHDGDVINTGSTTFHWNAPSSCTPDGYSFNVSPTSDPEANKIFGGGVGPTEYAYNFTNPGTYYISVRACKTCTPYVPGPWVTIRVVVQNSCNPGQWEVSLFEGGNYGGLCHTFGLGQVNDLSSFGLSGNVSSFKLGSGVTLFVNSATNRSGTPGVFTTSQQDLGGNYWNDQIKSISVEQTPDTSCNVDQSTANGILLTHNGGFDTSGGCKLVITDIPDLFPLTYNQFAFKFLGTYKLHYLVTLYKDTNYSNQCGSYFLDEAWILDACSGGVSSLKITPFTPPAQATNLAPLATRDHAGTDAVVDGDLTTSWAGTNKSPLGFVWSSPQTIQSIALFNHDPSIYHLDLVFSDGTIIKDVDMTPLGTKCADVTLNTPKTVSWVNIVPTDGPSSAGFNEVQIFGNDGTAWSMNNCSSKFTMTPVTNTTDDPVPLGQEIPANCVPGNGQAAFFTGIKYSGQCVVKDLAPYADSNAIGLPNDTISSVKLGSGVYQVILYENENFSGGNVDITANTPDLSVVNANNWTSSARVTVACIPGDNQVTFYKDANYTGECWNKDVGNYPDETSMQIPNDSMSSVVVGKNARVILYGDSNYGGNYSTLTQSTPDLSTVGLNDTVSSAKVFVIAPSGQWVFPNSGFTFISGHTYTMQAKAWPTTPGDPAVDHVTFTGWWAGHPDTVGLCVATQHDANNVWSCTTNFSEDNGGNPLPAGQMGISFGVWDSAGNVSYAPGEVGSVQNPVPTGQWVSPTTNGFSYIKGHTYTISAKALPSNPVDPSIDHVNFVVILPGQSAWVPLCSNVTTHDSNGVYSCTTDFKAANGGSYPSPGGMTLSFDVFDSAGNAKLSPGGGLTGSLYVPAPTGQWVFPSSGFSFSSGQSYTFQAKAWTTNTQDPAIDHVNFTGWWAGHPSTVLLCSTATHDANGIYSCTTNFTSITGGNFLPAGQMGISFDVYDSEGNVTYGPNGGMLGSVSMPVPTGQWVSPITTGFNYASGTALTLSAKASPGQQGDPAISTVTFSGFWPGHPATVNLCSATQADSNGVYSCTPDLTALNGGTPIPPGQLGLSFGVWDSVGHVTYAPDGGRVGTVYYPNLAVNRPTVSSSDYTAAPGYTSVAAVDGNMNTRWSSLWSDNQWIYVDLGAVHAIHEVKLYWDPGYGKSYQIQVSNDATNWTTIYSTTNGQGGNEDLTNLSGSGRYVRMLGIQRGSQWGYSLWEFEVYGA